MKFKIRPRRSFRENAFRVIRAINAGLVESAQSLSKRPEMKEELHETRIKTKKMRDIMELLAPFEDRKFNKRLERIRETLALMGRIHDLDVVMEKLRTGVKRNIPAAGLAGLKAGILKGRKQLFGALSAKLDKLARHGR